jgi:DNA-binding response OmpR family regulator
MAQAEQLSPASGGTDAASAAQQAPPRILIAEDNTPTRVLLESLLTKASYDVTSVTDGCKAWQSLLETLERLPHEEADHTLPPGAFDLLLCDSRMPVMDGPELVRRLRAHPRLRQMFVIVVTADSKIESLVSGLEGGADDYVTKPFRPAELLARVKSGLRIRALQRDLATLEHQLAAVHLATVASHEINNPLMIVLGNLEMIKARVAPLNDAEIKRRLDTVIAAAQRIQKVAQQLRNLKNVRLTVYLHNHKMIDLSAADPETGAPAPATGETLPAGPPAAGAPPSGNRSS